MQGRKKKKESANSAGKCWSPGRPEDVLLERP